MIRGRPTLKPIDRTYPERTDPPKASPGLPSTGVSLTSELSLPLCTVRVKQPYQVDTDTWLPGFGFAGSGRLERL